MPVKYEEPPYDDASLYFRIAYLKHYPECLLSDAATMFEIVLDKAGSVDVDYSLLQSQNLIKEIHKRPRKSIGSTRVYILSSSCRFLFAMFDVDECVADALSVPPETANLYLSTPYAASNVYPELLGFSCTQFIFKGDSLVSCNDLDAGKLADHLCAFSRENQVQYNGVRDSLYGAPRRAARQK